MKNLLHKLLKQVTIDMSNKARTDDLKRYLSRVYGVHCVSVRHLKQGVTNTNFVVVTKTGKYIFKIYNFKNTKEVAFEVNVLRELEQHHVRSPRLLQRVDGSYLGTFLQKPCLLYAYIEGETIDEWNNDILEKVGECMGNIHVLLKDFKDKSKCNTFDYGSIKKLVRRGKKRFVDANFPDAEELIAFVSFHLSRVSFPDKLPEGVTHHDIKPENVIFIRKQLRGVIDFDLAYCGVLLNDIATTIIWTCFNESGIDRKKVTAFLVGYEKKRLLTNIERASLGEAIYYRLVREVFSSPFDVLPNHMDVSKMRSDQFRKWVEGFVPIKDTITF